jgi:hypothetical protein
MQSDLVGPACLRGHLEQCIPGKPLDHLEVSFGVPAAWMATANGHLLTLVRMVPDGLNDAISISVQSARYDRRIGLLDRASFKLRAEFEMNFIGLSNQDHSTGFAI